MQGKLLSCKFYHSIYTVLLSFFRVANTYFPFCWTLFRKFSPPVLVLLREFSFVWRTALIPFSRVKFGYLSILSFKESSVTLTTTMSLIREFFSFPHSKSLKKIFNCVMNSSNLWPTFCL